MSLGTTRGPTYKVVLLGELGVGKTSLFRRIKENIFDEFSTTTQGIDSCTKVFKVDGESITVRGRSRRGLILKEREREGVKSVRIIKGGVACN